MEIQADLVKKLREKSGAGFMDCKRALSTSGGDMEKAIEQLRKDGVLKAAKKSGRTTLEGLVGLAVSSDHRRAALVELNCETDFVARTDPFQNFLQALSEHVLKNKPVSAEVLNSQKLGASTIAESIAQLVSKIGENISIRRFRVVEAAAGEVLGTYVHAGSKIGCLIRLRGADEVLARDVAMHTAAMNPPYVNRKQVPESVLVKEQEIFKASPDLKGKPETILEKIVQGKLSRFFSEVCLMEQPFIKDPGGKKTVGEAVREKSPQGEVVEFIRFQVGEETV